MISDHLKLYRQMLTIRRAEERMFDLYHKRELRGSAHFSTGMEAISVGVCSALELQDYVTSTHRGHGHALAKGMSLSGLFAELFGRETGPCRGKGGSLHLADRDCGFLGADAVVGGSTALAVGAAYANKLGQTGRVVVCFFGDGAANEGLVHEAFNLAALTRAPVVFVCENNQWAVSTFHRDVTAGENIASRARGYGIGGEQVDGNDVLAVREATASAVERARRGEGPSLLEAISFRISGHSAFANTQNASTEDLQYWTSRDPIERFAQDVLAQDYDPEALQQIDREVVAEVEAAVASALAAPWPDPAAAFDDVVAREPVGISTGDPNGVSDK